MGEGFWGNVWGVPLSVSKNQGVGLGSPLPRSCPPSSGGSLSCVLPSCPAVPRFFFLCGFWSSLCLSLLLFLLFPSLVLLPLSLLLVLPRCWLPFLVLGGLLPCRLWLCRCLVWTRSLWSARTVVSVFVVLRTPLVPWVVRSRWTLCSLVCRLVLGRLFASVLRSVTRLIPGSLVLKLLNSFSFLEVPMSFFFRFFGLLGLLSIGLAFLGALFMFPPVECLLLLVCGGLLTFACSFGLNSLEM